MCINIDDIHQNLNYRVIEIAHSHVTMATTEAQCWPQTKEVTIINVLSKN